MAGYHNFSMSNNAVTAYNEGKKPLSKWTKTELLEQSQSINSTLPLPLLKKLNTSNLRSVCLRCSEWHHTSNHFNKTSFYCINDAYIKKLNTSDIEAFLADQNDQAPEKAELYKCKFLVWSGSRKHPKCDEYCEIGLIKGQSFYSSFGRKNIYANGFEILGKVEF